jgi:hypothetical protein
MGTLHAFVRFQIANPTDVTKTPIHPSGFCPVSMSRVAMGTALPALFVSGVGVRTGIR